MDNANGGAAAAWRGRQHQQRGAAVGSCSSDDGELHVPESMEYLGRVHRRAQPNDRMMGCKDTFETGQEVEWKGLNAMETEQAINKRV